MGYAAPQGGAGVMGVRAQFGVAVLDSRHAALAPGGLALPRQFRAHVASLDGHGLKNRSAGSLYRPHASRRRQVSTCASNDRSTGA